MLIVKRRLNRKKPTKNGRLEDEIKKP